MEPLRIQQQSDGSTTAYDAETLFEQARAKAQSGDCEGAVRLYDRLADEFPESRFRSPGLYNAGFCLQAQIQLADAAARYERLLREGGAPADERHGALQLAQVYYDAEGFVELERVADLLLRREDLRVEERAEALARRAQALLGRRALDLAESAARETLLFQRARPEGESLRDNTFVAAAAFVLGEIERLRSEAVLVLPGAVETQRAQLEVRARHLLNAQQAYFDTIGFQDARWSSAAGYQIGAMYEGFWRALMEAPAPEADRGLSESERSLYEATYRERLLELARPLLRHAVRYWELTLLMVERTQAAGPWSERIRSGLTAVRNLLAGASPASPAP